MYWQEFSEKYPNLSEIIRVMGTDSNLEPNTNSVFPEFLFDNFKRYEEQASQLSDEEREILARGEEDEQVGLVERTGFSELDSFLLEIFDGILHDLFWAVPT